MTPVCIASALFGKTQQAVLGMLFGQPERSFYLRELVAAAGGGASQVQRLKGSGSSFSRRPRLCPPRRDVVRIR